MIKSQEHWILALVILVSEKDAIQSAADSDAGSTSLQTLFEPHILLFNIWPRISLQTAQLQVALEALFHGR